MFKMRTSPNNVIWVVFWIGVASTSTAAGNFRKPKCLANEFRCVDQEKCIHEFDKCDGKKDCADGSDETQALCWEFGLSCGTSPFSFKCAYGACIDKSKECDGKGFDCADNSDEEHCSKLPPDTPEITSRCQSWEFTCTSGHCVNLTDVCDGTPNCEDKTDESIAQCSRMSCPPFSFQCAYGACIDWDKRCNGEEDCVGGSDEADNLCNKPVDTPGDATINKADESNSTVDTCPFPSHEHTTYRFLCTGPSCAGLTPGVSVKKNQAIAPSCPPGYALPYKYSKGFAWMVCLAPPNFSPMITCEKMCPPLVSDFHDLECKMNGKSVPCDEPMHPGTYAHLECKQHFKPKSDILAVPETRCQSDGTWNYDLYKCIPECGRQTKIRGHTKVARGTEVSPGEAPWYAGFWGLENGTYKHFCGGTIIAPHLIITAAHCLTGYKSSEFTGTTTDSIANIKVAVAKFSSKWDTLGEHEQRVGIKNFQERKGYVGAPGYEKDLAVVELLHNLKFNNYVLPACVDWDKEGIFWAMSQGYIVGFGKTENNVASDTLQAASLSYIPPYECNSRIRESTKGALHGIMWDQFCAGTDAEPSSQNLTSVQQGDSGGGYTFKRNNKYYLTGVLSHHLEDVDSYAVYTNIPEHIDWLKENGFDETLA